jgi:hypothetical protein
LGYEKNKTSALSHEEGRLFLWYETSVPRLYTRKEMVKSQTVPRFAQWKKSAAMQMGK